jgi:hypothetical protein
MKARFGGTLAAIGLMLAAVPTFAHHAIQAQFDFAKPLHLTGTVTKMEWIFPHAYMFLDVKDASGKVRNWALEMVGPESLRKAGLSRTDHSNFKVGDTISVTGFMSRDGAETGFVREVKLADGQVVTVWYGQP